MRPPFIRVLPAEVEQYGPHGAILLAHIRYRCLSDGPERVTVDGVRWWRVSHVDMANETGLSVRGVKTALQALGEAVAAKHFSPLSDRSYAYRVMPGRNNADLPLAVFDQWNDLPKAENGESEAESAYSKSQKRLLQEAETANVLLPETLQTGENRAGAGERNEHSVSSPAWATPPPKCLKHPDGYEHGQNCQRCGALRRWDQDAPIRRKLNYDQAWKRYNALREQAVGGVFGDWQPVRPPGYPGEFDADVPWVQPVPPPAPVGGGGE